MEINEANLEAFISKYIYGVKVPQQEWEKCNLADMSYLLHLVQNKDPNDERISKRKEDEVLDEFIKNFCRSNFLYAVNSKTDEFIINADRDIFIFTSEEMWYQYEDKNRNHKAYACLDGDFNQFLLKAYYSGVCQLIVNPTAPEKAVFNISLLYSQGLRKFTPEFSECNRNFDYNANLRFSDKELSSEELERNNNYLQESLANSKLFLPVKADMYGTTFVVSMDEDVELAEYCEKGSKEVLIPAFTNLLNMRKCYRISEWQVILIDIDDLADVAEAQKTRVIVNPNLHNWIMDDAYMKHIKEVLSPTRRQDLATLKIVNSYLQSLGLKPGIECKRIVNRFKKCGLYDFFAMTVTAQAFPENTVDIWGFSLDDLVNNFGMTYLAAFQFMLLSENEPEVATEMLKSKEAMKDFSQIERELPATKDK